MLLNIKIIPLKIILVLLNSIIMLHTVKRNDPKVKQKDYSDKKNDYNAKRKYYNVKRNDYNVKRNDNNIIIIFFFY
jgi:quinol-cytochrome oxidoreductase complex cytochrome b subunit